MSERDMCIPQKINWDCKSGYDSITSFVSRLNG